MQISEYIWRDILEFAGINKYTTWLVCKAWQLNIPVRDIGIMPIPLFRIQSVCWDNVYKYKLSVEFIALFHDKLDLKRIKVALPEEFIAEHITRVNWRTICSNQTLSEAFIEKFIDQLDWKRLSLLDNLSEALIERHADRVNWYYISCRDTLSDAFIERNADNIIWSAIFMHHNITSEFITRNKQYINNPNFILHLLFNYKLTESVITDHIELFKPHLQSVSFRRSLSEAFITKYIDDIEMRFITEFKQISETFIEQHLDRFDHVNLICSPFISEEFIERNHLLTKYRLHRDDIKRANMSNNFLDNYSDYVDWTFVSMTYDLTDEFIKRYYHRLDWGVISEHRVLSASFIWQYMDKLSLSGLIRNQTLSREIRRALFVYKYSAK